MIFPRKRLEFSDLIGGDLRGGPNEVSLAKDLADFVGFEESIEELEYKVEIDNDVVAMMKLADCHMLNIRIKPATRDSNKACLLYHRAAAEGFAEGQLALAMLCFAFLLPETNSYIRFDGTIPKTAYDNSRHQQMWSNLEAACLQGYICPFILSVVDNFQEDNGLGFKIPPAVMSQYVLHQEKNIQMMKTCNNPTCSNTEVDITGGGSLLKCAHCLVSRYCSKACQNAHWKAHKKICKKLRLFVKKS